MTHSTTLDLRPLTGTPAPRARWTESLAAALHRLQWLVGATTAPAVTVPEAALELLRLAERYEDQQPSYAADLRAAAHAAMGREDLA